MRYSKTILDNVINMRKQGNTWGEVIDRYPEARRDGLCRAIRKYTLGGDKSLMKVGAEGRAFVNENYNLIADYHYNSKGSSLYKTALHFKISDHFAIQALNLYQQNITPLKTIRMSDVPDVIEKPQAQLGWMTKLAELPDEIRKTLPVSILRSAGVTIYKCSSINNQTSGYLLVVRYPLHGEKLKENIAETVTIIKKALKDNRAIVTLHTAVISEEEWKPYTIITDVGKTEDNTIEIKRLENKVTELLTQLKAYSERIVGLQGQLGQEHKTNLH